MTAAEHADAILRAALGNNPWAGPYETVPDDTLAAVQAAMDDGPQWRTIDSAPRDGTEFLGYHRSTDNYTGDWFALVEYSDQEPGYPWWDLEGSHPEAFLTHWQPLPTPPKEQTHD